MDAALELGGSLACTWQEPDDSGWVGARPGLGGNREGAGRKLGGRLGGSWAVAQRELGGLGWSYATAELDQGVQTR